MGFPSLERSVEPLRARRLACKRARQLNRGAAARLASRHIKPASMALEEIAAAKVEYRVKEEGETAKA
jgi:DNA-directed RNA polymerase subunit K/omega